MSEISTVQGTVYRVEETKEYGSNGLQKRVMVIEVQDGQYSQKIPVEAVKDKCAMFDGMNEDDIVTAYVNLRGSEWQERFFLSLNCWKVETDAQATPSSDIEDFKKELESPKDPLNDGSEFDQDVPF